MDSRRWIFIFVISSTLSLSCIPPTEPVEYSHADHIYQFIDVQFADEQHGLLVASLSVWRTVDGGRTWDRTGAGGTGYLKGVGYADPNTAIVVGNYWTVDRTTDGAETWSSAIDRDSYYYSAGFNAVSFGDPMNGWIVGSHVFKTVDGGETWERQSGGTLKTYYDVCFTDVNTGTIVSNQSISRTVDGGETWVKQKDNMEENLLGVSFIDANTGIVVGTHGLIMRTDDGGDNWTIQRRSPESRGMFWDVCLTSADTATVVGSVGTILWTTDGGRSWIEKESGTDQRLRAVTFVNSDTGLIVGGNNVILRTENGGQKWTSVKFRTTPRKFS
jgi:photosystem II stability/assembly factor-like uncharacterized protein